MKNFLVIRGPRKSAGLVACEYKIHDVVPLDETTDLEDQMRNYVDAAFAEEKSNYNKDDISCRRKNIVAADGRILVHRIKVFDHEDSTYFGFIPVDELK